MTISHRAEREAVSASLLDAYEMDRHERVALFSVQTRIHGGKLDLEKARGIDKSATAMGREISRVGVSGPSPITEVSTENGDEWFLRIEFWAPKDAVLDLPDEWTLVEPLSHL